MTKSIILKDVKIAADSLYKTQKIKIGSKSINTPSKAIDIKKVPADIRLAEKIKGVKEIFRTFTEKSINTAITTDKERQINNEIDRLAQRETTDNQLTLSFVEFDEKRLPSEKEIEFLTDISYVHSDATPLPLTPGFCANATLDDVKKYETFLKQSIKTIEELNHKPIMGVIPMGLPREAFPAVLDVYENEGVNAFCVDFHGRTVSGNLSSIRALLRQLKQRKMLENSLLYGLNIGQGKLIKDKEVVPARDILSFGMAFDVFGGQHFRPKLPKEVWERIAAKKDVQQNKIRMFNKDDYGYYKINPSIVSSVYPKDSQIPVKLLENAKTQKEIEKVFNMEQQALEATHLQQILAETDNPLAYIQKKKYVEAGDIKNIQNLKKKK